MGTVYRARDTTLQRDVAIKVLNDDSTNDPANLERFKREAKAVAGLFDSYFHHELQFRHTTEMETNDELQQQVKEIFITVMEGQRYSGRCDMSLLIRQTISDIRAIEVRGGKVLFVRLRSDGGFLNYESQHYPREAFWTHLINDTGCHGIHFRDYPELENYLCPEWSHLAEPDAIQFTLRFLDILQRQSAH